MSEPVDACMFTEDNDLPVSITHARDLIVVSGKVAQDYRFLTYRFKSDEEETEARMYFDEPWSVYITAPQLGATLPPDVLAYFQKRFNIVKQLGGPDGYTVIWSETKESS